MDNKKKVAAAVAATIAASGAAVDASFDNPADILQQDAGTQPQIQYVDLENDQDSGQLQDEEKKQGETVKSGPLREWILHLPLAVRTVFVLPFWFIGHLVVLGGTTLFAGLSPVLHWLLGLALIALVIAGAFTVTAKAMFPDLPIRYFYSICGTEDSVYSAGAGAAKNLPTVSDRFTEENWHWQERSGGHDFKIWNLGLFNFLQVFCGNR